MDGKGVGKGITVVREGGSESCVSNRIVDVRAGRMAGGGVMGRVIGGRSEGGVMCRVGGAVSVCGSLMRWGCGCDLGRKLLVCAGARSEYSGYLLSRWLYGCMDDDDAKSSSSSGRTSAQPSMHSTASVWNAPPHITYPPRNSTLFPIAAESRESEAIIERKGEVLYFLTCSLTLPHIQ